MQEMADKLRTLIEKNSPEDNLNIDQRTIDLLKILLPAKKDQQNWDIENLLSKLYQLIEAGGDNEFFNSPDLRINKHELKLDDVKNASARLLKYLALMCELSSKPFSVHGSGKVDYLSDFIHLFSNFGNRMNIFTINIDLCIEAAITRLSQFSRNINIPKFTLYDGFDNSLLPVFSMNNYRKRAETSESCRSLYYWKLHGSIDWTYSLPIDLSDQSATEASEIVLRKFSDELIIYRRSEELKTNLENCGALSSAKLDQNSIMILPTPAKYSETYRFPFIDLFEAFRGGDCPAFS